MLSPLTLWDFLIVGAGPAGAMAAYELAKHGPSVLLIDQSEFPRKKVCGGCLSHRALGVLQYAGLGELPQRLGAKRLHHLHVASRGRFAKIFIPQGASLSRERFDFAMIGEARNKGAVFLSGTKGVLYDASDDFARVRLWSDGKETEARARMVLACDGLLGSSLAEWPAYRADVRANALIGISTTLDEKKGLVEDGCIGMAFGQGGYAGLVRQEDNRLEIAAALHPRFLKSAGSPGLCVQAILKEAGFPVPENILDVPWHGAPPFPRFKKILGGRRFLVLGDAAGFVEPLTGEGIFWALLQAQALAQLLRSRGFAWHGALPGQWELLHQKILGRRKKVCGLITALIRNPALCSLALSLINRTPWLVSPIIRYIHGQP